MSDMSQGQYDPNLDDPDGDQAAHNREGYENRQKDRADKEKQRGDSLERELALVKAGIDTETEAGKFFANGYDGELDPKVIKATAQKVAPGALKVDPPPPAAGQDPNVDTANTNANTSGTPTDPASATNPVSGAPVIPAPSPEEAATIAAANNLAAGAPADQISKPDPYGQATELYDTEMAAGGTQRDAAAMAFSKITEAALEGDDRVTLDPLTGRRR